MTLLVWVFSLAYAQTCEVPGIDQPTPVTVFYQQKAEANSRPVLQTGEIGVGGTVDPKSIEMDGLEVNRTSETITQTVGIPAPGMDPSTLKFVQTDLKGRLVGQPVVGVDGADPTIAILTATVKYEEGRYDSHDVYVRGYITYQSNDTAELPVIDGVAYLPEQLAFEGSFDPKTGRINPVETDANLISEVNKPDRVIVKDASGCVWYAGKLYSGMGLVRAFQSNEETPLALQGKELAVIPFVAEDDLKEDDDRERLMISIEEQ